MYMLTAGVFAAGNMGDADDLDSQNNVGPEMGHRQGQRLHLSSGRALLELVLPVVRAEPQPQPQLRSRRDESS